MLRQGWFAHAVLIRGVVVEVPLNVAIVVVVVVVVAITLIKT